MKKKMCEKIIKTGKECKDGAVGNDVNGMVYGKKENK